MAAQSTIKNSQELLIAAGQLVDKFLKDDHTFYDLSGLLGIATDSMLGSLYNTFIHVMYYMIYPCIYIYIIYFTSERANVSGNLDSAYPALNSSLPALAGMPFLGNIDHTPLPQELLQEFESKGIDAMAKPCYCVLL